MSFSRITKSNGCLFFVLNKNTGPEAVCQASPFSQGVTDPSVGKFYLHKGGYVIGSVCLLANLICP